MTLLPKSDFALLLVTNLGAKESNKLADLNEKTFLEFDPLFEMQEPRTDSKVILGGVPYSLDGRQYMNTGVILSQESATKLIAENAAIDPRINHFDSKVEFIVQAPGQQGMSGGGVFSDSGAFLGVIVRAGQSPGGTPYIRVVKATYIVEVLSRTNFSESLKPLTRLFRNGGQKIN